MNKLTCIENVVYGGKTVFVKDKEYSYQKEISESGNLEGYWVHGSSYGEGFWQVADPTFAQYFDLQKANLLTTGKTKVGTSKPKSFVNNVVNLFKSKK